MSNRNEKITIGQILELQPGTKDNATWVNGEWEAAVSDCKTPGGKAPNTCVFTDPHNPNIAIVGNFFGGIDPSRWNGKIVHVSGSGIARTEYKGVQQITLGAKATIQVVGDARPGQASSGVAGKAATGHATAPSAIHGATVGMAINQACQILKEFPPLDAAQDASYFLCPGFSKDLWTIASDIIRVSQLLESGKLAKSAKDRADPEGAAREEAAKKAEADRIEAERKAKEEQARREANLEPAGSGAAQDDVPFAPIAEAY